MADQESKVTKTRKKTGGRKKGTPNKLTQSVVDKLAELNCDPIAGMAKIAALSMQDGDDKNYKLASDMYKELACYIAQKKKAVDIDGESNKAVEAMADAFLAIAQKLPD